MHKLELRRQILHFLYGPLLILLYHHGILRLPLLGALILVGAGTSYLIKHHRLSFMSRILAFFERPHHLEQFPGRGILFFTLGAYLCLALFNPPVAYAGIMILSAGDAVANLVGRNFGRIKTRLNPNKSVEGMALGILVSIPFAYFFVPQLVGAAVASLVAMFLELPNFRLFGIEIDDNVIIPVAASFTLNLFV